MRVIQGIRRLPTQSYHFPVETLKSQADVLRFAATLEKGAVSAYLGAVPLFGNRDLSMAAASILGDEAPVPAAFMHDPSARSDDARGGHHASRSRCHPVIPARGEAIYSRCLAGHAPACDRTGPRHCGVFGRRAGSVKGVPYSDAGTRTSCGTKRR